MLHISRITNGELIFDNLKDYVDIEEEKLGSYLIVMAITINGH